MTGLSSPMARRSWHAWCQRLGETDHEGVDEIQAPAPAIEADEPLAMDRVGELDDPRRTDGRHDPLVAADIDADRQLARHGVGRDRSDGELFGPSRAPAGDEKAARAGMDRDLGAAAIAVARRRDLRELKGCTGDPGDLTERDRERCRRRGKAAVDRGAAVR